MPRRQRQRSDRLLDFRVQFGGIDGEVCIDVEAPLRHDQWLFRTENYRMVEALHLSDAPKAGLDVVLGQELDYARAGFREDEMRKGCAVHGHDEFGLSEDRR
jgi:hypothetical protein